MAIPRPAPRPIRDRTVLVTGATNGIGLAVAQALVAHEAKVLATGRSLERIEAFLHEAGDRALGVCLDVKDPHAVAALPEQLTPAFREVDTLVLAAGHDVGGRRSIDAGAAEDWTDIIETNVNGVIRVARAFLPLLLKQPVGHIVTIGSNAGLRVSLNYTTYCASKFAVHAFTEGLKLDYADTDLRVSEILPGLVKTGFAAARLRGDEVGGNAYYEDASGYLDADDVAAAVMYALEAPAHVNISQIVIEPNRQR